jgi:hypothetical protein
MGFLTPLLPFYHPPTMTTGHYLLEHVITFILSHSGTLSEQYSCCSNYTVDTLLMDGGRKTMRHS